jgi:hypothetical protein
MSNDQQPFPGDFRLRLLNSFRESAPTEAAIEAERVKLAAETAEREAKAKAQKADAEALEIYTTWRASNGYQRAFIRTQYGTAILDHGKALYDAKGAA